MGPRKVKEAPRRAVAVRSDSRKRRGLGLRRRRPHWQQTWAPRSLVFPMAVSRLKKHCQRLPLRCERPMATVVKPSHPPETTAWPAGHAADAVQELYWAAPNVHVDPLTQVHAALSSASQVTVPSAAMARIDCPA